MGKFIDLVGQTFGELRVVKRVGTRNTCALWECECSCGNSHRVISNSLLRGACKSCGCRGTKGSVGEKQVYNTYRCNARNRGHDFNLERRVFYRLLKLPCKYCGCEPSSKSISGYTGRSFTYNGIDRVDNNLGYTVENSVPCCEDCNRAKLTMSAGDYIDLCRRVSKHNE